MHLNNLSLWVKSHGFYCYIEAGALQIEIPWSHENGTHGTDTYAAHSMSEARLILGY